LSAGTDANLRRLTAIKGIKNNPSLYDLVIIGTPIWSSNISTPIRTYLSLHKEDFKNVAFFCTRLGSDANKVFDGMKNLSQKTPLCFTCADLTRSGKGPIYAESERIYKQFERRDNEIK